MTLSLLSVAWGALAALSNDSSSSAKIPIATTDVSILTFAEVAPFSMVTNGREEALFCRSLIIGVVDRVIVGETCSTLNDDVLPFRTVREFEIAVERVNSYT